MRYEIDFSPEAAHDLDTFRSFEHAKILDGIESHLRHEPTKESKSRIKDLRGVIKPQYRLRIDDIRVFYDVTGNTVEIIAVLQKKDAAAWLEREGIKGEK
jgi:mRNA interferase RelE/StbE